MKKLLLLILTSLCSCYRPPVVRTTVVIKIVETPRRYKVVSADRFDRYILRKPTHRFKILDTVYVNTKTKQAAI